MKKILLIFIASTLLLSCGSKKFIIGTTINNLKVSAKIPGTATTNFEAMVKSGSSFASGMSSLSDWKGYIDGDRFIFIMWSGKGTYKDIYQMKGATETAYERSNNLLRSEIISINDKSFYINALKGLNSFKIKASTYFDTDAFAVVIECKEKDFPEAQKKLMNIIESLKIE